MSFIFVLAFLPLLLLLLSYTNWISTSTPCSREPNNSAWAEREEWLDHIHITIFMQRCFSTSTALQHSSDGQQRSCSDFLENVSKKMIDVLSVQLNSVGKGILPLIALESQAGLLLGEESSYWNLEGKPSRTPGKRASLRFFWRLKKLQNLASFSGKSTLKNL